MDASGPLIKPSEDGMIPSSDGLEPVTSFRFRMLPIEKQGHMHCAPVSGGTTSLLVHSLLCAIRIITLVPSSLKNKKAKHTFGNSYSSKNYPQKILSTVWLSDLGICQNRGQKTEKSARFSDCATAWPCMWLQQLAWWHCWPEQLWHYKDLDYL